MKGPISPVVIIICGVLIIAAMIYRVMNQKQQTCILRKRSQSEIISCGLASGMSDQPTSCMSMIMECK